VKGRFRVAKLYVAGGCVYVYLGIDYKKEVLSFHVMHADGLREI